MISGVASSDRTVSALNAALIFLGCLFFVTLTGSITLYLERIYNQQKFEENAHALYQSLSHIISASDGVINSIASVYQLDENMDSYELATLTQQLFDSYPFITKIVRFQLIPAEKRTEFEQQKSDKGYFGFKIQSSSENFSPLLRLETEHYAPITLIEPNDPLISRFIGMDLLSQSSFTHSLNIAVEDNKAALMLQPEDWGAEPLISILRPTYFGHFIPNDSTGRREQLEGGFIAVANIEPELLPVIKSSNFSHTDLILQKAGQSINDAQEVYRFDEEPSARWSTLPFLAPFVWQAYIKIGSNKLIMTVQQSHLLSEVQLVLLLATIVTTLILVIVSFFTWRHQKWAALENHRAREAMYFERERAEITLQSIGDAVITTDERHRIVYLNPIAEQMIGNSLKVAKGLPADDVLALYSEENGTAISLSDCLKSNKMVDNNGLIDEINYQLRNQHKESITVKLSSSPISNLQKSIIGNVTVLHDISAVKKLTDQLTYQAMHDSLTGIPNRRYFEEKLKRLIALSDKNGSIHTLCYIDLDQFKLVNDTCGHPAGDELLTQLTELFKKHTRDSDTLARLGGDEFGLLLENCATSLASELVQRIRSALHDFFFAYEDKLFNIRASIGVVEISRHSGTIVDVLSAADIACYSAKDAGRDEVCVYNPKDQNTISRRGEMQWSQTIQSALANDNFVLYLQPIVALKPNEERELYEFLVRLQNTDGNLINPSEFLSAAERYGLMKDIDYWVIEKAASLIGQHIRAVGAQAEKKLFSINLSGQSMNDLDIVKHITQSLINYNVPTSNVGFEVTETAAIENLGTAVDLIEQLRELGCSFALDDFGSGLSSFGYLKRLPIDYLKVDGQFVKGIMSDEFNEAMVRSMIDLAKVRGIQTVCELVETASVNEKLKSIGVDFSQGYYHGQPEPAEVTLKFNESITLNHLKLVNY